MGSMFTYRCLSCGYKAEVCGGTESGMAVELTTISCDTCKRLFDVVTFELGHEGRNGPKEPRCPRAKRHPFRVWTFPGACPKCGQQMESSGEVALWD